MTAVTASRFAQEMVIIADDAMPYHLTDAEFKAIPATEQQLATRDLIYEMQALSEAGVRDGVFTDGSPECTLVHRFSPGIYVREFQMKAGSLVVSKRHAREHIVMVLKGTATVTTEYGSELVTAPAIFISHAGAKRVLQNHTDTIWATVHRTDAASVEEAEAELIINDREDVLKHLSNNRLKG